jgi:hypothetical protein
MKIAGDQATCSLYFWKFNSKVIFFFKKKQKVANDVYYKSVKSQYKLYNPINLTNLRNK